MNDKNVVIIGGGLGGLFTGAILAKEGYRVTVLEKNATIGGGLQTFRRMDEDFDTGIHVIAGMRPGGTIRRICDYLSITPQMQLRDVDDDCADELFFLEDRATYRIACGRQGFVDSLLKSFPDCRDELTAYADTVQTCRRVPDTQTGFRLYPLRKLWGYRLLTARYEAELELLVFAAWHGVAIHSIPVDVYYPPAEERVSHFRPGADFARISALNTLLCGLAVVYGLPCWLWRKTATILRTLGAFLFFVFFMMAVITPGVWLYVHCGRMTERKKWRLHLLIYHAARIVGTKIGVPGARYHSNISKDLDFDKPSVLICNHQSHLDLIYLLSLSPRLIFLTNDWVWHNPFYGFLIRHAEYYPAAEGIDVLMPHFRSLISRGYSIAVFPEGTRSFDGHIARFHQGAFHVAEALGLDIIPACLYGTGRVLKKRTYHLAKSPVYMEVGSPLSPSDLQAMGDTLAQARHVRHDYLHHYQAVKDREEQHA